MSVGDPRVPIEPDATADGRGDRRAWPALRPAGSSSPAWAASALVFVGAIILSRTLGPDGRGAHAFYVALTILLAALLGLSAPTGGYILAVCDMASLPGDLAANADLAGRRRPGCSRRR